MEKHKSLVEPQLLETFSLLDKKSVVQLGTLFANDVFVATAPRLADWLTEELSNEILRRENGIEGSPTSLNLDDWPDAEIGQALAGCLLLRRACILPMQEEFTALLTDVVSVNAIKRLITEAGVPEWN